MTDYHDLYDDNVTTETEDKLDEALARLAAGTPAETILPEAGEDEAWLRPLLEIAADVNEMQQRTPIPPPDASLNKMLAHAKKMSAVDTSAPRPGWLAGLAALFGRTTAPVAFGFRTAALAMSLVLTFLAGTILGGSLTAAAHDSLPGQTFYGLKRTAENIRLNLTWSPAKQAQLANTYNHRRRLETELLLEREQVAAVAFNSQIQAVSGSAITLTSGLTAQITADTVIEGELAPGARVRIEAETRPPGSLQARAITVIEPAPPTPTPTATPTATTSPTPQPTAAPTKAQVEDTLVLPPTDAIPDDALEESDPDDLAGDANDNEPADDDDETAGGDAPEDDAANDNQNDNDNADDEFDDNPNDNVGDDLDNEDDDDLDNEDDDLDDNVNDNPGDDLDDDAGDDDFDDNEDEGDLDDDLDEDDLGDDSNDDFDDNVEDDLDNDDDFDDDLDDDFDEDASNDSDNSDNSDGDEDSQDDEDASDSDDSSDDDEGDEKDEEDEKNEKDEKNEDDD